MSIFKDCSENAAVESFIVDLNVGQFIELDKSLYSNLNEVVIAVDAPIRTETYTTLPNTRYFIEPPCGCFSLIQRDVEVLSTTYTWENIILKKDSY